MLHHKFAHETFFLASSLIGSIYNMLFDLWTGSFHGVIHLIRVLELLVTNTKVGPYYLIGQLLGHMSYMDDISITCLHNIFACFV